VKSYYDVESYICAMIGPYSFDLERIDRRLLFARGEPGGATCTAQRGSMHVTVPSIVCRDPGDCTMMQRSARFLESQTEFSEVRCETSGPVKRVRCSMTESASRRHLEYSNDGILLLAKAIGEIKACNRSFTEGITGSFHHW
jgi:hypothetical protein